MPYFWMHKISTFLSLNQNDSALNPQLALVNLVRSLQEGPLGSCTGSPQPAWSLILGITEDWAQSLVLRPLPNHSIHGDARPIVLPPHWSPGKLAVVLPPSTQIHSPLCSVPQ